MTNMEFMKSASRENLTRFVIDNFDCKYAGICSQEGKACIACMESWMMQQTENACRCCKWHDDFTAACFNGDSDERGEFTDENCICPKFERKETE